MKTTLKMLKERERLLHIKYTDMLMLKSASFSEKYLKEHNWNTLDSIQEDIDDVQDQIRRLS